MKMNTRTEILDRIDAFFDGNLPDKEIDAFFMDLENDPEFRAAYERYARTALLLREAAEAKAVPLPAESPASEPNGKPFFLRTWLFAGIAASVLLLITFWTDLGLFPGGSRRYTHYDSVYTHLAAGDGVPHNIFSVYSVMTIGKIAENGAEASYIFGVSDK